MAQREVQTQRSVQRFLTMRPLTSFSDDQHEGDWGDSTTARLTVTDRNQVVRRLHQLREAQSETNLCYTMVQHRHHTQARLLGELKQVQRQLRLPVHQPLIQRGKMGPSVTSESSVLSVHGDGLVADVGTGKGNVGDCKNLNSESKCDFGCDESVTEGKSACKAHTTTCSTTTTTTTTTTATSVSAVDRCLVEERDEIGERGGAVADNGLYQTEPYDHSLCSDCSVVCDLAHDCVRRLESMQVQSQFGFPVTHTIS